MEVPVYDMEGRQVSTVSLAEEIFGVVPNEHLVHMAVVWHLANQRQGTQSAKTRGEVRGGGRKPWRQKGTGHARQGSIRAPQWKGGGVVFAPKPRDYSFKLNKKERRLALKSALASRVEAGKFVVLNELKFDEIKTKKFVDLMQKLDVQKAMFVLDTHDKIVERSARNIPNVFTTIPQNLSTYAVMKAGKVVVTLDALKTIEEVYA